MPGSKVVLISSNSLCHNPRTLKEADALSAAGFQVEVLGGWLSAALAERDRALLAERPWKFIPVVDFTGTTPTATRQRIRLRLRTKLGRMLKRWLNIESPWQLGYTAPELLAAAQRTEANLFIAHSEPALWAASRLQYAGGTVGVDMEDWFSEDLLPKARGRRPVRLLRSLERQLLHSARHRTCTSHAMSEALAKEFGCTPPTVIYNTFPWAERRALDSLSKDRRNSTRPSLHWFSQTIGAGRGLEELFEALPHLPTELEIHLRGNLDAGGEKWLRNLIPEPWRAKVFTHSLVTNSELLSRIAEHDIGFAGEMKYCRSRNLTVTNKLFQYLLGGLAVIASDTEGQREIAAAAPEAVSLYPSGNAQALAAALNRLLDSREALLRSKAASLRAAEEKFCWEKCASYLVSSVQETLCFSTS